jgi:Ca2+-binding EF-hand superfamily protein
MISRRKTFALAVTALIGAVAPASAASSLVGQFDTDKDGSVDLGEAKKAAADLFDKLDVDKDGTLGFRELHGRLSRSEFVAADADKDGTLSKGEYLAAVEERFKAADTRHTGKLVTWQFHTPKGRALARLLR